MVTDINFKEDLSLKLPLGVAMSANGQRLAYLESYADWERNDYFVRLLVQDASGITAPEFLAEGWNSISTPIWLADDRSLCWHGLKDGKSLLAVLELATGKITKTTCGWSSVNAVGWDRLNKRLIVIASYPESNVKNRSYTIEGQPAYFTQVEGIGIGAKVPATSLKLPGVFYCGSLQISPSFTEAVFTGKPSSDARDQRQYLYLYDPAGNRCSILAGEDKAVFSPTWHDSRRKLAYLRRKGAWNDLDGADLYLFDIATQSERLLYSGLEYSSCIIKYDDDQILLQTQTNTIRLGLHQLHIKEKAIQEYKIEAASVGYGFSLNADGERFACIGMSPKTGPEILVGNAGRKGTRIVSDYTSDIDALDFGKREWLNWKSRDGEKIEGLLISKGGKKKSRAVLVIAHGGPVTSIFDVKYLPFLNRWTPYPIPELLHSGISIFLPNYRGSAGNGTAFRTAIKGRLGKLECQDIISGIHCVQDHLDGKDLRIGIAGWSYGGFLAALLGTKFRELFSAVSVGAGISDILLQYWAGGNNMAGYLRNKPDAQNCLSPMDFIHPDCPPILIQHGAQDSVISPTHSLAFYRKLRDAGVRTELITYTGNHVISKPQEMLWVRRHNWEWFSKHLLKT